MESLHANLLVVSRSIYLLSMQPLSLLCGCLAGACQHLALQHACFTYHEGFRSLQCET